MLKAEFERLSRSRKITPGVQLLFMALLTFVEVIMLIQPTFLGNYMLKVSSVVTLVQNLET